MSSPHIQSLSSSLQRRDWPSIERHLLPSRLPAALSAQVGISPDLELSVPAQLRFSIEGLPWPNKFFGECLKHLLALHKGLGGPLPFSGKMGLIVRVLDSLGRPGILGESDQTTSTTSRCCWMRF